MYVAAHVQPTVALQARAALLVSAPGSYASHHTAARLWGGWAPPDPATHVSTPTTRPRSQRRGIAAHRARPGVRPVRRAGVPTARPAQVFLDLASVGTGVVDLVVVGDSLVRTGEVSPAELIEAATSYSGPGCRQARRAAAWVRTGTDSVMESRLRMLLVLAGLPEPVVNHVIRDDEGAWVWRIDLSYPERLIAIEYDGRHHVESSRQWRADLRRREDLENRGWRVIVVVAEGVFDEPGATLERVRRLLRDRGATPVRRRPPPEWHRCFPTRTAA